MKSALTLILDFSAPITLKKYISAVQMLLGLWYLLQQPRRNKTVSDSGSQYLTIIAMDITKQRKRVKAGSGTCFIFTGLISDIFDISNPTNQQGSSISKTCLYGTMNEGQQRLPWED